MVHQHAVHRGGVEAVELGVLGFDVLRHRELITLFGLVAADRTHAAYRPQAIATGAHGRPHREAEMSCSVRSTRSRIAVVICRFDTPTHYERSEERRGGKGMVSTSKTRGSTDQ